MIYALSLGAVTLAAAVLAGRPLLQALQRFNVGKEISEWGPESHQAKAGTPTMGGLLILGAVLAANVAANLAHSHSISIPLGAMLALAAIGFVDDLGSLRQRRQWALNKRVKLVGLISTGIVVAFLLYWRLDLKGIAVPYGGLHEIGGWFVPLAAAVLVLTAGGVAVTDGLDGLAAGTCAIAYAAYGGIAVAQEQGALATFCFAVVAACLAFLCYNSYPAQMFMGDVGALALGGGLAVAAFMTQQWLVLPLIGIVFVLEGASVYGQIAYFKLSGGKRILRMAPLHHHFEAIGWSEVQVVQRFWVLQALGAFIGVVLALEV
ncbi:MAG TPA: phospho-N-acetylmuramoyl-pentapeptide-transferase [Dehalococcoidia bacterium]|nr:phospho-N-acetylmuramoyl-pentapeptide-transferase [Dehalococcoidia bacterium]